MIEFIKLLEELKGQDWVDITTKFVQQGKYKENDFLERDGVGFIKLKYDFEYDVDETDILLLEKWDGMLNRNFIYIQQVAANRDHLIDYLTETVLDNKYDVGLDVFVEAKKRIVEYGEFLKKHLRSIRWSNIFHEDTNKFCYSTAQLIWNFDHTKLRRQLGKVRRKMNNAKYVPEMKTI